MERGCVAQAGSQSSYECRHVDLWVSSTISAWSGSRPSSGPSVSKTLMGLLSLALIFARSPVYCYKDERENCIDRVLSRCSDDAGLHQTVAACDDSTQRNNIAQRTSMDVLSNPCSAPSHAFDAALIEAQVIGPASRCGVRASAMLF